MKTTTSYRPAVSALVPLLCSFLSAAQTPAPPPAPTPAPAAVTSAPEDITEDRTVNTHYNIHQPAPVTFQKLVALPAFCIPAGLTERHALDPKPAGSACAKGSERVETKNAADIVTELQSGTEFIVAKADDQHLAIFCKAKNCRADYVPNAVKQLEDAILQLARPQYAYFKDNPVADNDTADALAKAVPSIIDGLSAEVVTDKTVRIESDRPLNAHENSALDEGIKKDLDRIASKKPIPSPAGKAQAARVDLPVVCLPDSSLAESFKPLNDDGVCDANYHQAQTANAPAIVQELKTALGKTPDFDIGQDGNSVIIACLKGACDGPAFTVLRSGVSRLARPQWPYSQEIDVAKGTSELVAGVLTHGGIKTFVLTESRVRLTSDVPVSDRDRDLYLQAVRERGFGSADPPPLQRMFYQDASNVVGSLSTTPLPEAPETLGEQAPNTGPAAASSSTAAAATTGTGVTVNVSQPAPAPAPTGPAAPSVGPAPSGTVGQGMTAVNDNVVFTDTSNAGLTKQRLRLLTLLDLPRPEVLMNVWSLQASSPKGKEIATSLEMVRKSVEAHNDALQNSIDYGWAYLSRQMKDPDFFDLPFYSYLTRRFVGDSPACEAKPPGDRPAPCITDTQRDRWGLCPAGTYCLGYSSVFEPLRPTFTSILLGMMAARNPVQSVLTTIGCMEGKYEVYPECFPDRPDVAALVNVAASANEPLQCVPGARKAYLDKLPPSQRLSCEVLDKAALEAQRTCKLPVALPLSCFTIQAAKSFLPDNSFSTFSVQELNELAETNIPERARNFVPRQQNFSSTNIGLLRAAVANFLFNYKISQQFPREFGFYSLPHSAQELNALFNPLVVAFNEDVAIFSRTLMERVQDDLPKEQQNILQLWRHNQSFIANGLVTVRGISGVESLIDTDTQSSFDATQAQTLSQIVNNLMSAQAASSTTGSGTGTGSTTGSTTPTPPPLLPSVLNHAVTPLAIVNSLAALTPTPARSLIGRQLTLDVTPHTLPGANSAELDVKLWAQEDSPPTIYPAGSSNGQNDSVSRVARHNVMTRVRVESVKLFDLSTFSAMIQRPRTKFPIIPPFVELPLINGLLSIPLPAAKIYYASSAIVSAIIVPTAADLAYGIEFTADRAVFTDGTWRHVTAQRQFPDQLQIYGYHHAITNCLAMNGLVPIAGGRPDLLPACPQIRFQDLPSER